MVKVAGFTFPPKLFALIALLAVSNTALMNMIMASRLVYGMAREHVVPPVFAVVHPSRSTPWIAILFTVAIAVVLVATGEVGAPGRDHRAPAAVRLCAGERVRAGAAPPFISHLAKIY